MNEKASKGRFLKAEKERRRREKVMVALLVLIIATLEIVFGRKNCRTQKVHLAITFSKIGLDI